MAAQREWKDRQRKIAQCSGRRGCVFLEIGEYECLFVSQTIRSKQRLTENVSFALYAAGLARRRRWRRRMGLQTGCGPRVILSPTHAFLRRRARKMGRSDARRVSSRRGRLAQKLGLARPRRSNATRVGTYRPRRSSGRYPRLVHRAPGASPRRRITNREYRRLRTAHYPRGRFAVQIDGTAT